MNLFAQSHEKRQVITLPKYNSGLTVTISLFSSRWIGIIYFVVQELKCFLSLYLHVFMIIQS